MVKCRIRNIPVLLMTSHLESMKNHEAGTFFSACALSLISLLFLPQFYARVHFDFRAKTAIEDLFQQHDQPS